MLSIAIKIERLLATPRALLSKFLQPLLLLIFRFYVAEDFMRSGIGRFKDFLNGSWETQIFLFEMEHPVPFLSPGIAATLTTAGELVLPALLIIGLFSRFAAAGLFIMALVIQVTYQESFQHILWMSMTAAVFVNGAGTISADYAVIKLLNNSKKIDP
jgi:putative oxidoreductase